MIHTVRNALTLFQMDDIGYNFMSGTLCHSCHHYYIIEVSHSRSSFTDENFVTSASVTILSVGECSYKWFAILFFRFDFQLKGRRTRDD